MLEKFDINALNFYLENVEATKRAREAFLRGEEVDLAVVPRHVYDSWVRSVTLGIDPHSFSVPADETRMYKSSDQLLARLQENFLTMEAFNEAFHFRVTAFDAAGRPLTNRSRGGGMDRDVISAMESGIGTSSGSIAAATLKPATCFGWQNFKKPFCRQFGLSLPIARGGGLYCMLTAILDPEAVTQKNYVRAALCLELIGKIIERTLHQEETSAGMLSLAYKGMADSSDGVVTLNSETQKVYYNAPALRMLDLPDGADQKLILDRVRAVARRGARAGLQELEVVRHGSAHGEIYMLKPPKAAAGSKKRELPEITPVHYNFQNLLGKSPAFVAAKNEAFIVAPTDAPVLLLGQSGAGKELFAQSIHSASNRKNKPFVAINCGSVARDLMESELFDYEAGAFTGASSQGKIGVMEAASGGTLFLDEIESLSQKAQAALLRALSTGMIRRVGSVKYIPIDLRIISATKIDLLGDGGKDWGVKFRPDLYYRLSTCIIEIPPLKARTGDIELLTRTFVERERKKMGYGEITISKAFLETLNYYDWRGNVRELENVVARAVIFMDPERLVLDRSVLYPSLLENSDRNRMAARAEDPDTARTEGNLHQEEILTLQRFLTKHGCNVREAAKDLGISRQTLYRKIQASDVLREMMEQQRQEKKMKK